jgi:Phage tail protein (Tail_P2_I)
MGVAGDLQAALAPWTATGPDLADLAAAIGGMFAEVESYTTELDENGNLQPAWTVLFDPDQCPTAGLPWLAQCVGERLPIGLSDAQSRQWIKDRPNQRRGTNEALARAAERQLTAGTSQVVIIWEGHKLDGTATLDYVAVLTLASQTPNPSAVRTDVQSVAPWDVIVDYSTVAGIPWLAVHADYATWAAVHAACPTWAALEAQVPTGEVFSR